MSPSKFSINAGVTAFGILAGSSGGVPVGILYFGIDQTIGWDNAMQSMMEMNASKLNMIKMGITNYSDYNQP